MRTPEAVKEDAREMVDETTGQVRHFTSDLKDRACHAMNGLREEGHDLVGRVKGFVREKPVPALVGCVALGLGIAYLLRPKSRRQGWMDSLDLDEVFTPIRKKLRAGYKDLRSRGSGLRESIADHLPDHPVESMMERARGFGKILKFR